MVDKKKCIELYQDLKDDLCWTISDNIRREMWFLRSKELQKCSCWYHYKILMRKQKEYEKSHYKHEKAIAEEKYLLRKHKVKIKFK